MMAMLHSTYPATATTKAIQVYMSPELPKRPQGVKEVGSIVYADRDGSHTVIMLDVEDRSLAEFVKSHIERSTYLTTRIEGLRLDYRIGPSLPDAIQVASRLAAK